MVELQDHLKSSIPGCLFRWAKQNLQWQILYITTLTLEVVDGLRVRAGVMACCASTSWKWRGILKTPVGDVTRAQIKRLVEYDPTLNNRQIADVLNISRQGVHWHVKNMPELKRISVHKACDICGVRIKKTNHGWCRKCRRESYSYEFVCGFCKKVNVTYGYIASARRNNLRIGKSKNDYCNRECFNKLRSQNSKKNKRKKRRK